MKKIFLIAGLIAGLTATSGYAVGQQAVVVTLTCPQGCELVMTQAGEEFHDNTLGTTAYCKCPNGNQKPTVTTKSALSLSDVQEVDQVAVKNTQKQNKVSVRSATVMPKMTKKIVYEEIVSDDAE